MESVIVTKDSFRDWKANPVTKAVMDGFRDQILRLQDRLGNTAGENALQDRYTAGVIAGYKDLILVEFDEVSNGN